MVELPDPAPAQDDLQAMTKDLIAGFTVTIQMVSKKYPNPNPMAAGAALVHMLASYYANIPDHRLRKGIRKKLDAELSHRQAQLVAHMERNGR